MQTDMHYASSRRSQRERAEILLEVIMAKTLEISLIWWNTANPSKSWTQSKINPEPHNETHYNQTVEIQRQKMLKIAREEWPTTLMASSINLSANVASETWGLEGSGWYISMVKSEK